MWTTRSGSLNGRLRKKRSLIRLKMAVFKPIPSASVRMAMKVNAGDCQSFRKAKRRSLMKTLFGAQRLHWIDKRGATRRQQTRQQRNRRQQNGRAAEQRRIVGGNFKQLGYKQSPERERGHDPDRQSNNNGLHPLINNQTQDITGLSAEC